MVFFERTNHQRSLIQVIADFYTIIFIKVEFKNCLIQVQIKQMFNNI